MQEQVRSWALTHGWERNERSPHLFRSEGSIVKRLEIAEYRVREQIWVPCVYAHSKATGYWRNAHVCSWSAVYVEGDRLVRTTNLCRRPSWEG